MRRAGRMDHERFRVADVGKMRKDSQCLDELAALRARSREVEAYDGAAACGQQLLRQLVIRMIGKLWVSNACHQFVGSEKGDDLARVLDMPRHAQWKRFDPLQDLEGRERRHARAEIANALAPRAQ